MNWEGFFDDLKITARQSVVDWAEQHIILPPVVSRKSGPFRVTDRPYIREPLENFGQPGITDQTFCWGAQLAKTTTLHVGGLYRYYHGGLPQLYVLPSAPLARDIAGTRFGEIIKASPVLAEDMPSDKDDFALLLMRMKKTDIRFASAGTVPSLSAHSMGTVIGDEAEKYPPPRGEEAPAMELIAHRTKSYEKMAMRVFASTPTTPETLFYQRYLDGDQRKCFVSCIHCRGMLTYEHTRETLVWSPEAKMDNGRWNLGEVMRTAHYVCPHCGGEIRDEDKLRMAPSCEWVPGNNNASPGHRSYQLSSFFSPDVTFGDMARHFLNGFFTGGLKDYYNGWLGLPYEQREHESRLDNVKALCEAYCRGICPIEDPAMIGVFADPGLHETHWVAIAYTHNGAMMVFDCGTVASYRDILTHVAAKTWKTPGGKTLRVSCGLVDSGTWTKDIYDLCLGSGGLLLPSKGEKEMAGSPWSHGKIITHRGLTLVKYQDKAAKDDLYIRKIADKTEPRLTFAENMPGAFFDGLTGQKLIRKRYPGGYKYEWKPIPNDHYGDCVKQGLVFSWQCGFNLI